MKDFDYDYEDSYFKNPKDTWFIIIANAIISMALAIALKLC